MLDLSNSHHYKEVVNLEFTKLNLISYYSRGRSSSEAIMGKLHPFGQRKWNNRKRDSSLFLNWRGVHFVQDIHLPLPSHLISTPNPTLTNIAVCWQKKQQLPIPPPLQSSDFEAATFKHTHNYVLAEISPERWKNAHSLVERHFY